MCQSCKSQFSNPPLPEYLLRTLVWYIAVAFPVVSTATPLLPSDATTKNETSFTTCTPDDQWRAGRDYSVLLGKMPTKVPAGRVELLELFMYTSSLSHQVQPYLQRWLDQKPSYIDYIRRPAVVFPHARLQAQAFFTLQELRREDLHQALFSWVAEPAHYKIYHTVVHPDELGYRVLNLEFARVHKLNGDEFERIYNSNEVQERVIRAEIDTHGYLVSGTSTFVVNGRFSTSVQRLTYPKGLPDESDYLRLFALIEYLAAKEAHSQ